MSEIYQRVAQHAVRFRLQGDWAFLPLHATVRRVPQDSATLLAGLRESFSDEDLEAAGLLTRNGDGQTALCANLQTSPRICVALHSSPDAIPYDILGPCGSLAGQQAPCLTAVADAYTAQGLLDWRKYLFAVLDIREVAILRSLGLPVTLANGLAQLDGSGLRQLLGQPQCLPQHAVTSSTAGCAQRNDLWNSVEKLVLVGWSIANLNARAPRGLSDIAALLNGAQGSFGFDASRIMIWRPKKFQLEQIQLATKLRDVDLTRQTIIQNVHDALRSIEHYVNTQPGLPARDAFRVTRANLMAALRLEQERKLLSPGTPSLCEAYQLAANRAFVAPLVHEAASADSPIDGALLLSASSLVQEHFNTSPLVLGCTEHTSRTRVPWVVPLEPELFKQHLKRINCLIAIRRELRK